MSPVSRWHMSTSELTILRIDSENLGQLQESFDSLEQGSRKMLAQVNGSLPCGSLIYLLIHLNVEQDNGGTTDCEEVVWILNVRTDPYALSLYHPNPLYFYLF